LIAPPWVLLLRLNFPQSFRQLPRTQPDKRLRRALRIIAIFPKLVKKIEHFVMAVTTSVGVLWQTMGAIGQHADGRSITATKATKGHGYEHE